MYARKRNVRAPHFSKSMWMAAANMNYSNILTGHTNARCRYFVQIIFFFVEINLMCASLYLCDFYSCSTTVSYFYKNTIRRAGVIEAACVSIDRFVTFGRRTQTRCLLDRKYSNNCEWISLVWLSLLISFLADGWCCCYYSLLLSWMISTSLEWLARHIIANYHGIPANLLQNTLIRKYIADVNNMPTGFMWSDTFAFQSQSSISSHFQSIAVIFNPFAFECLFLCPCASHYRPIQWQIHIFHSLSIVH